MSRYRKIEVRTWSDERFRALSGIPPSGQGLWFFLLTGPHTTAIPGLFRAGRAGMAEELGWEQEAFDEAFREVFQQGMAKADFKARLVWLPKAIRHNKPESPNVVRGWKVELNLLPECDLKREAMAGIRIELTAMGASYVTAFDEVVPHENTLNAGASNSAQKPMSKPSPKPSEKAMPNQEQEQEQEQQQEQDVGALCNGSEDSAADAPPTQRGTRLPKPWALPKAYGEWALQEFPSWTPDIVRSEASKFADYWHGVTGKGATKLDWPATWRNWCRNAKVVLPKGAMSATDKEARDAEVRRLLGYNQGETINA